MPPAQPLTRYSAIEGALARGCATAELHQSVGHDLPAFHSGKIKLFSPTICGALVIQIEEIIVVNPTVWKIWHLQRQSRRTELQR